jgi:predicted RNA-binding Zn-ribbon protein involved in translation (DUF1610 family)
MKVLKKGRKQQGYSSERTCTGKGNDGGGCGAKLLVEEADLFQTSSSVKDETDYYVTFKCPECGVLTDLERPTSKEEEIAAKNGRVGTFGGRDDT